MLYEKGLRLVHEKRLNSSLGLTATNWKDLEETTFAEHNVFELKVLTSGDVNSGYLAQGCTLKVYTTDNENYSGAKEIASFVVTGADLSSGETTLIVPGTCKRFVNVTITTPSSSYFPNVYMTVIGRPVQ